MEKVSVIRPGGVIVVQLALLFGCTAAAHGQTEGVSASVAAAPTQDSKAAETPSIYDRIWRFREWYRNDSNPVIQRFRFSGRYQHDYAMVSADQGDENEWNVRRMRLGFRVNLFRTITATRLYQLTSARSDATQDTPREFARAAPRGLSPEQFFDSLALATGFIDTTPPRQRGVPGVRTPRNDFLAKFANQSERRTEPELSVVQALALMNGDLIQEESAHMAKRIEREAGADREAQIDHAFLLVLSREAKAAERAKLAESGLPLDAICRVLLNSNEFLYVE